MGRILSVMIMMVVLVVGYVVVQGTIDQLPTNSTNSSEKAMLDIMPLMLGVVGLSAIFAALFGGAEVYRYVRFKKWRDFGGRIKAAYTAKFGYPNLGFEQEVDQHIKAMEALGHGDTRTIDEDWLKRMAVFVEIPYIIPEEEHLSEVEKTEQYDPCKSEGGKRR